MEELSASARNIRAAVFGVVAGIAYVIATTFVYKEVGNPVLFNTFRALSFVVLFGFISLFAVLIRKRNLGYLDFKAAFGVIFIMILVATTINFIYNYIYVEYLDPSYPQKLKAATLAQLQSYDASKVAQATKDIDRQIEESKSFSLGTNLLTLTMTILYNCLPGLIVAFLVKKNKPANA